jgi:hypothetical protein
MIVRWIALGAAAAFAASAFGQSADGGSQDVERVVRAAEALVATVGGPPGPIEQMAGVNRRDSLLLAYDDANRESWTYWPTQRAGLPLELMTAAQRTLVHDLLRTVLSSKGHNKVVNIMQLEQILKVTDEAGFPRDVGHYTVAFFGEPSTERPWSWRFEGHHVSLNVSVSSDGITVTPTFLGSNPGEIRTGALAGFRVLSGEEDLARELAGSFTAEQRSKAVLSDRAPNDIFTGNLNKPREEWKAWRETLAPEGIPVEELNEVQQHWVRRILDEVVSTYRPEISEAYLASIDVADLSFAWMGSTERREPHYYRLQGSDFVFEFDNVQNGANHVHSVWRSKASDFGASALEQHYQAYRH